MKNHLINLLLLLLSTQSLTAQEWQDYTMPDDSTIFHKMCIIGDQFWATDYGEGRVYKSDNAGLSWQFLYQTEGEFLEAIQFLDDKTGYLCGDYGIIMRTLDGGQTWTSIAPKYAPRITKDNEMAKDSAAIKRYFYQLYFKDENNGLVWGFETQPLRGFRETFKRFYYETNDGGSSWKRIEYSRGEDASIVNPFLADAKLSGQTAMAIYHTNEKAYRIGNQVISISNDERETWTKYLLPQLPDERRMLRYMHFVNEYQGYILGGNLEEESSAYVLETLDGGHSWQLLPTELPHIHVSVQRGNSIFLAGKEGLLKQWTPTPKARRNIIHKGSAERILVDGQIGKDEWLGASRTVIQSGIDLYMLQDDYYLYLSLQYDTTLFANYYADLFFDLGNDTLLNVHASQQVGERLLTGSQWTESDPAFTWGYRQNWTSNVLHFDRTKRMYIPYSALEFQISKDKLPTDQLRIALKTRDVSWEKEMINIPENDSFKSSDNWLLFHWE